MSSLTSNIELAGYGIGSDIGGLPRQTYYTPDGRTIRAIAQIRGWVRKDKDGKIIASGTRDANLDKGWLTQKPSALKPYCPTCDQWHETPAEIKACKVKQDRFIAASLRQAKNEEAKKNISLEEKVAALEAIISKLTGGTDGPILQPNHPAPRGKSPKGNGKTAKGVS